MTKSNEIAPSNDNEMRQILETLLADDEDITARAVARLHPSINAASSITRSEPRSKLLAEYQQRQAEYRRWRARVVTFRRNGAGHFRRNDATGNERFEGSNGDQGCLILPPFASSVDLHPNLTHLTR